MKIIYKKVSELIPYVNNPRKNDKAVDAVASSIKNYGFRNAILIDAKNEIINGHTRLKAAQKLGMLEVPCVMAEDLTPSQVKGLRIADNKVAEAAEWDYDLLKIELDDIDDFTGFDLDDLNLNDKEITEDDFNTDEALENIEEPITKRGDIWRLGNHRLMCGDSTSVDDVEKLMDGNKADMVFTDPPYEIETKGGGILKHSKAMKGIRELKIDKYDPAGIKQMAKTNIFCCNKPLIKKYIQLAENWGVSWDLCFYKKNNTAPNYGGHLMTDTEYLFVIGMQSPNKGLEKELYSKCYIGQKDADNETAWSKPIGLCVKFIKLYSNPKNIVLDMFGGSGSTLIACEETERICYMMELDEKYCDVIIKRWETLTGKKAEKVA